MLLRKKQQQCSPNGSTNRKQYYKSHSKKPRSYRYQIKENATQMENYRPTALIDPEVKLSIKYLQTKPKNTLKRPYIITKLV